MIQETSTGPTTPSAARAEDGGRLSREAIVHPLELAAAHVFLVSDESSFVYGTPILMDGGFTAKIY
jgi:NAD(P)-dependent dehydrogenase (short-subunit alcohol dehydrogenase family)